MTNYIKSPVENIISVTSIATVWQLDLRDKDPEMESHDFPEILYVTEGAGCTVVNGKQLFLQAGQMIIYAPNSVHKPFSGGTVEIISFDTATVFPVQYCNRPITLSGAQRIRLHQLIMQTLPMFETRPDIKGMVLKSHADQYDIQNAKNKLELFLLEIIRPDGGAQQERIDTVTDYMLENIHRMLTLQEISNELGISVSSLKRLMQEHYCQSPAKYFGQLKLDEAKRLILNSPMNMTQIAEALGFSSVHYFSRVFKQQTGKSPTDYKECFSK